MLNDIIEDTQKEHSKYLIQFQNFTKIELPKIYNQYTDGLITTLELQSKIIDLIVIINIIASLEQNMYEFESRKRELNNKSC